MQIEKKSDFLWVILSLGIQIPLALLLGHYYDERVFMTTGYVVNAGISPYQPVNLSMVFIHPLFGGITPGIGYPPLWPLLLGAIYHLTYNIIPNLYLYNFAIKIPVIVGNIALAYALRNILLRTNEAWKKEAQFAWLFILFSPFILLTSTAWGAFDTVVALLTVISVYFLSIDRFKLSAFFLAISVAVKPIAFPLIGLPLLFYGSQKRRKNIQYLFIFSLIFLVCFFAPFFILGWNFPLAPGELNAHFRMAGGLSPLNIIELFSGSQILTGGFWIFGFMWIPATAIGYYFVFNRRPESRDELAKLSIVLILIFFLTRSWLSETNINIILPLMLLAIGDKKKTFLNFHFAWIIPLFFMFLNFSFPQLFFLPFPSVLGLLSSFDLQFGSIRLIARFLIAVIWQLLAWYLVIKMVSRNKDK
jgi:Glycosyltransferase family 87